MIAFVFPGQGSQKPGMGKDLYETSDVAKAIFDQVAAATGIDVAKLCFETDEETLRQTQNAQVALYTCGVAAAKALQAAGIEPKAVAGHSVGEYAALAAAGVITVEEGAKLVQTRGKLMAEAGAVAPGAMAAILGLDREPVEAACAEAEGVVVVANDNSPGQLVISGEPEAVAKAGELAKAKGAKRVLPLNVSGAFHSPLMVEPSNRMAEALAAATWSSPTVPVYANVTAASESEGWAGLLERQLASSVRWTETIQRMRADGVETFVECGVGEVLTGLLKRIDREAKGMAVQDSASLATVSAALGDAN